MDNSAWFRQARSVAPFAALAGLALLGWRFGFGFFLLGMAASVLMLVIALLWRSLASLATDESISLDEALSLSAPSAEEEQKQAVLRTLKDLEYERSVGKISEEDYRELAERYRGEAKRLIQMVDADLEQRRERVEEELGARLKKATSTRKVDAEAKPESDAVDDPIQGDSDGEAREPSTRACGSCGQTNDFDAAFCKKCGAPLAELHGLQEPRCGRAMSWKSTLFVSLGLLASSHPLAAQPAGGSAASNQPAAPHPTRAPAGASPHDGRFFEPKDDLINQATDLPAGVVEAVLVDADDRPLRGVNVRLGILFQTVAEGEQKSSREQLSNADGRVRFSGLTTGSSHSYRISTHRPPAEFASPPFVLKEDHGERVVLHVYAQTSDLNESLIGTRGFIYVEPRDNVFQIEILYRIFNMSRVAWVPSGVVLKLPDGFKAFTVGESMTDTRFEESPGRGAALLGTFSPGQHDISFRFQIPNPGKDTAEISLGVLPQTAELRVIAEKSPSMRLEVTGFESVQEATGQQGQPVLVTRKVVRSRGDMLDSVHVTLLGLPVAGPGRWVAVLLALCASATGLGVAVSSPASTRKVSRGERKLARQRLFQELIALERARSGESIGPRTYERAKRVLVDAIARLDPSDSDA